MTDDLLATPESVARDALTGLLAPRKTLPPALFYDEEGCRLFYEITRLPEYYLTRTEFALLETTAAETAAMLRPGTTLVEYGASDEAKAARLLRQTRHGERVITTYVPIDVAGPALVALRTRLEADYRGLRVLPLTADFMQPIVLPPRTGETGVLGFFPGSTIGNLEPAAAVAFLDRARRALGAGGTAGGQIRFLLGFDTCRDPGRLVPAYDDASGVTAAFNLNLLTRLNRETGADFDPALFSHRAVWNGDESRIEIHLVSRRDTVVSLAGHALRFAANETIHTENSYKYAPERMEAMAAAAGWTRRRAWTDPEGLFAMWLLEPSE